MRKTIEVIAPTLAVAMSTLVGGLVAPAVADSAYEIDGTYTATSNGQWAKTNERYQDEATAISTWTINTTCNSPYDCTGTVSSDMGWTATIFTTNGPWRVDRDLPNWQPCPDGTTGRGRQIYMFGPVAPDGQTDFNSTTFAGIDKTTGESGACGVNKWLVIEMPFTLVKVT